MPRPTKRQTQRPFKEHSQRVAHVICHRQLVTFESFYQSDEETFPDQGKCIAMTKTIVTTIAKMRP